MLSYHASATRVTFVDAQTASTTAFILLQTGIEVFHHSEDAKTSAYCSLGVIFMGLRIAKVHQESIPEQLSDMPIVALDNLGTHPLICTHHVTPIFRVELRGQFGGIDQVAEYDRELPSFSVWGMRCWWRFDLCRWVLLRDDLLNWWWRG
jgi:hypothetical protein